MENIAPTKGNLIIAQSGLARVTQGYDLLDRKRKLLQRELTRCSQKKQKLREELSEAYTRAYESLREANVTMGLDRVASLAKSIPEYNGYDIKFFSVMGVEVPEVKIKEETRLRPHMSLYKTNLSLDEAVHYFTKARNISLKLAAATCGSDRLKKNVSKTQIRANALKNIMIPRYTKRIQEISAALEEKEREEFARLKVVKKLLEQKNSTT